MIPNRVGPLAARQDVNLKRLTVYVYLTVCTLYAISVVLVIRQLMAWPGKSGMLMMLLLWVIYSS